MMVLVPNLQETAEEKNLPGVARWKQFYQRVPDHHGDGEDGDDVGDAHDDHDAHHVQYHDGDCDGDNEQSPDSEGEASNNGGGETDKHLTIVWLRQLFTSGGGRILQNMYFQMTYSGSFTDDQYSIKVFGCRRYFKFAKSLNLCWIRYFVYN